MDEFKTQEEATESLEQPTAPRWTGAPSIAFAQNLNVQCIDLLCELATTSTSVQLPRCVLQNVDLWRRLDTEARRRVAALPFVIVDLRFKDTDWWREIIEQLSIATTPFTPFADLALETLLFARQAAREDVTVAKTMFAMRSAVASRVASVTMSHVRSIASTHAHELSVRWDHDPDFWRDLLLACRSADEDLLDDLRRHAKLLFCGELVAG